MNNEWDRRADESFVAYEAFKEYLRLRSCAKVGQKLGKSKTLIDRWSSQNDWVARARAYDNALFENLREKTAAEKAAAIEAQWNGYRELFRKSMTAFEAKDFTKASFKSLNEIAATASEKMFEILDRLEEAGGESANTIEIKVVEAPQ